MMLAYWLILVFITGASVGSFANVCIARMPLEKSLLWPGSRCGNCLQPVRWYDNLPIFSYLFLRGKCRTCKQQFSIVYLLVEISMALSFVGLFWLEVVENVHAWPGQFPAGVALGAFPWASFLGCLWHAVLFAFLFVASVCDLKSREIPLSLTLTGTLVGLIGSAFMPWPWPNVPPAALPLVSPVTLPIGVQPWPFWNDLPAFCGTGGNVQTGLITGIVGALVGTFLLRAVGFVFSSGLGREALGLGDADLMMMAGAFVGWQIVVVAFFLSVIPALLFGIIQMAVNRDNSLPFGPSLSLSVMVTLLAWQTIGAYVEPLIFWGDLLFWGVIAIGGMMFILSFMIRLMRGKQTDEEEDKK
jgi:leader peptidase (prepilin peptidase)/N-methyltransferase